MQIKADIILIQAPRVFDFRNRSDVLCPRIAASGRDAGRKTPVLRSSGGIASHAGLGAQPLWYRHKET